MWGIVPNNELVFEATAKDLADQLKEGFDLIRERAQARRIHISVADLAQRSLITTSCGLGPATVEIAKRSLELLPQVSDELKGAGLTR